MVHGNPDDPQWNHQAARFRQFPGARQIIIVDVQRVQTSCGFGVPLMQLHAQRETLTQWARKKGPEELARYQRKKNSVSIDGLPTSIAGEQ
jgi:hypothetical protein